MRLFIASTFPDSVMHDLNDRMQAVKARLPPASWVRAESQHLTFAFLGEQAETLIDVIAPPLRDRMQSVTSFQASLQGCGFFPNARRARVGWVGLIPEEPFCAVAGAVREVVSTAGVVLDRADFRPHLTLMRMRDAWPPASIELFEHACRGYRSTGFTVDKVTLYSSQLNPKGAVHTALRDFQLA